MLTCCPADTLLSCNLCLSAALHAEHVVLATRNIVFGIAMLLPQSLLFVCCTAIVICAYLVPAVVVGAALLQGVRAGEVVQLGAPVLLEVEGEAEVVLQRQVLQVGEAEGVVQGLTDFLLGPVVAAVAEEVVQVWRILCQVPAEGVAVVVEVVVVLLLMMSCQVAVVAEVVGAVVLPAHLPPAEPGLLPQASDPAEVVMHHLAQQPLAAHLE